MASESEPNELYGLQTENRHLKEMVGALRDEMEKMRIGEQERLQKALAAANDEIGQLRNMIVALRDELDRRKIESEEKCRAIGQAARDEAKQLHEMIRTLRDQLEDHAKRQS
jgi:chromosome segregation ATPase